MASSGISAAAERGVCNGTVVTVAVPQAWRRTANDGIVSYRAPSSVEALTAAAYAIKDPAASRAALLLKAAEIERRSERRIAWAAAFSLQTLALSPVRQERHGAQVQTCWHGEDFAAKRKFVSVSSSRGDVLHHFYYQAVGISSSEFDRRAATIFGRDAPVADTSWTTLRIVRDLTSAGGGAASGTLKLLALPSLQVR